MPVPTDIADLSQTAASNFPAGSESPTAADDYFRQYAAFIAQLRDGKGVSAEATVASAATCDIGAANSMFVRVTGSTTITSLGTNYNGPRFIRFGGSLTLTHNATTLILPQAVNISTVAGDTCIAIPIGNPATGWQIQGFRSEVEGRGFPFLEDFGGVADGTTDSSTALDDAAAETDVLQVEGVGGISAPSTSFNDIKDMLILGEGELSGPYRKRMHGALDGSWSAPAGDLSNSHLPLFRKTKNPVVVVIGDSISTYLANTQTRTDMLALHVEAKFRNALDSSQTLTFYNRAIGGKKWSDVMSAGTANPDATNIDWWTVGQTFMTQLEALSPDVIVCAYGMNDSDTIAIASGIKGFYDAVQAWTKVPDLVMCTNLLPSLGENVSYLDRSEQDGRDLAAGFVRSYAKYHKLGLLDFNRAFVVARDGFDPLATAALSDADTVAAVSGDYTATTECTDFQVYFDVVMSNFVAGSATDTIIVQTGQDEFDWCKILKTAGGDLRFVLSTGRTGDAYTYQTTDIAWPGSGTIRFAIEVKENILTVYDNSSNGFGQYNIPKLTAKIIRGGGLFTPAVTQPGIDTLITGGANFRYFTHRKYRPLVKDSDLFNGGDYAGSAYNHPGHLLSRYVYRPVLDAAHVVSEFDDTGISLFAGSRFFTDATFVGLDTTTFTLSDTDYVLQHSATAQNRSTFYVTSDVYFSTLRIKYVADNTGAGTQACTLAVYHNRDGTKTSLYAATQAGFSTSSGTHTYMDVTLSTPKALQRGDQITVVRNGAGGSDTYGPLKVYDFILL